MPVGHYENFPVASVFLPRRQRHAIVAIYRFARAADDIADEGEHPAAQRLAALSRYASAIDTIERGETPNEAPFTVLAEAIREHGLPLAPLRDLLSAFAQDVEVSRYASFDALADYCRRSANSIGRLLLVLYRRDSERNRSLSDAVCTGLQLANFWQDVGIDWGKGRIYIPAEDLRRFGVSEGALGEGRHDARWTRLMRFETTRSRTLLMRGRALARELPWRAGLELAAVVAGGMRILERIDAVDGDVFARRPTLRRRDYVVAAYRILVPRAVSADRER